MNSPIALSLTHSLFFNTSWQKMTTRRSSKSIYLKRALNHSDCSSAVLSWCTTYVVALPSPIKGQKTHVKYWNLGELYINTILHLCHAARQSSICIIVNPSSSKIVYTWTVLLSHPLSRASWSHRRVRRLTSTNSCSLTLTHFDLFFYFISPWIPPCSMYDIELTRHS